MSSDCLLFSTVIVSKRLKPLIQNGWQTVAESRRLCHLSTHIFAWLIRNCESVVPKIRFDHRVFNKISTMEPLQKFLCVLYSKIFENIQRRKTCAATNYVRKTTFYFTCCRSFETLHCCRSLSYTDSSEL